VNGSGPEGPDPSGSGSPDELVAVDLDDAVERDRQLRERLALELPNTLAVEAERLADRLERLALAVEAETKLQDPPLALRQPRQRLANGLSLERLRGFLRRILSGRIVWFSDAVASATASASVTWRSSSPVACASSSGVGSWPSFVWSWFRARAIFTRRSWMCTGMRIVADWFDTARWQAWRIHQVAYVENL